MAGVAKLDGKKIPYEDILKMRMCFVGDIKYMEVDYRVFEPYFAVYTTLLSYEKGYELEKKVRKALQK